MDYFIYRYISPAGEIDLVSDHANIIGIWFCESTPEYFRNRAKQQMTDPIAITIQWLDSYFEGRKPSENSIPYILSGTVFQKNVWAVLTSIPYGQTMTYGQIGRIIAQKMGKEHMSAQAIGQAVGANPVSIVVPCHRVIGTNGKLVGYASGIDKKIFLLKHEGFL